MRYVAGKHDSLNFQSYILLQIFHFEMQGINCICLVGDRESPALLRLKRFVGWFSAKCQVVQGCMNVHCLPHAYPVLTVMDSRYSA